MLHTVKEGQIEKLIERGLELAYESNVLFDELASMQNNQPFFDSLSPDSELKTIRDLAITHKTDRLEQITSMAGFLIGPDSIGGEMLLKERFQTQVHSQRPDTATLLRDADQRPYK